MFGTMVGTIVWDLGVWDPPFGAGRLGPWVSELFGTLGPRVWDHGFGTLIWDYGRVFGDHCLGRVLGTHHYTCLGPAAWDQLFGIMGVWDGTTVWDQWVFGSNHRVGHGTSCCLGPWVPGTTVWDHTVGTHHFCLGSWGVWDPQFGTMCVWDHGLGPCMFGTSVYFVWHACLGPQFRTIVWDHACLGPSFGTWVFGTLFGAGRLGPWVSGTSCLRPWVFGTSCLGPYRDHGFGTIVWATVWDHGCLGPPTTRRVWDQLRPSFRTMFGTIVWDHRLGLWVFGTHRFVWFGTIVWDLGVWPGVGTMGVWDKLYGCSAPVVWDHTGPDHGCLGLHNLGPCVFGSMVPSLGVWDDRLEPAVWDHGCSGPAVWDHGCLGPCVQLFGTMVVWDALSGLWAGGFWKFWGVVEVLGGSGGFWWVPSRLVWDHGSVFGVFGTSCLGPTMKPAVVWDHGCPGTTVWDHGLGPAVLGVRPAVLGPSFGTTCLGPWVFVSFATTVWDHEGTHNLGTSFGIMGVWGRAFGTMGAWDPPPYVFATSVWDQLFGTIVWTMEPAVLFFDHVWDHTVWDHRLGPCLGPFLFVYSVWDHRLRPCMFGTTFRAMGVCFVWDHRLGPGMFGTPQFGTMRVWDHNLGPSFGWGPTFGAGRLGKCVRDRWLLGTHLWNHGKRALWIMGSLGLGPWLFGTMGVRDLLDPQFGTMRLGPDHRLA